MKNLMYDFMYERTAEGETVSDISVYMTDKEKNRELLVENIFSLSDDDMFLLYMDGGYENFYKEKEMLERGTVEMDTLFGRTEINEFGILSETIDSYKCNCIRLSPFFNTGRVVLCRSMTEIDCRGSLYRHVALRVCQYGRRSVRVSSVTRGMSLDFYVTGNASDSRTDLYINGNMIEELDFFETSDNVLLHIDELDRGLPYKFSRHMNASELCIAYDGIFDMMFLNVIPDIVPYSLLDELLEEKRTKIRLECTGYENQIEWLISNFNTLTKFEIIDDAGIFLSELDGEPYDEDDYAQLELSSVTVYTRYLPSCYGCRRYACMHGYVVFYSQSDEYTAVSIMKEV